ncbi:MAG TPA: hypothetical protein VMT62_15605 [Syntrophorhabdaceae bacterium]|nr:hypothetical protein [Syntrophorhabdaceae bacterium]
MRRSSGGEKTSTHNGGFLSTRSLCANLILVLMVTFLYVGVNCNLIAGQPRISEQCNGWIDTFFGLPLKEQIDRFDRYSIEDQYSIYICGNQVVHPPTIYLDEPFAKEGIIAVDFLRTELSRTQDDLTIRDIICVFREMSRQKTYDVRKDKDLVRSMTESVAKMKNEDWKRVTREMLEEITEGRKKRTR